MGCVSVDRGIALCLDGEGQCPEGVCGVDGFEPNDSAEMGVGLGVGGSVEGVVCRRDEDWFALGGVESVLRVVTAGEISVEVVGGDLGVLRSVRVPAGGSVEVEVPVAGRWVRVWTDRVVTDAGYSLSLAGVVGCEDDRFEPNDGAEEGTVIGGGADLRGVACPGDVDWFRVRTRGEGGVVEVVPVVGGVDALGVAVVVGGVVVDRRVSVEGMVLVLPAGGDEVGVEVGCGGCGEGVGYRLTTRLGR